MDMNASAQMLVKQRGYQEWWIGGIAMFIQFFLAVTHKYWLYQYVKSGPLYGSQILLFGLGLLFCSFWKSQIQKKLTVYLGKSFKDDLLSEVTNLQALNNPAAWAEFLKRSRWELTGIFAYSSILGIFFAAFVF